MTLRNLLFAVIGLAYDTPAGHGVDLGRRRLCTRLGDAGQVTAATLYVQALVEPLDRLIRNVDRLQVGIASTSRLLGIASVPQDREAGDELPVGNRLVGRDLRFAYFDADDVLHGIDLDSASRGAAGDRRAERLGQVDAGPATRRYQQAAYGIGHGRRRGAHRAAAAGTADRGRPGDPRAPRLRGYGARQHHLGSRVLCR